MLQAILDALSQQGGGAQRADIADIGAGTVVPDAEGYSNLAKGSVSATAGLPGDMEMLASMLMQGKQGYIAPVDSQTAMPTSRDVGEKLGADIESEGFGIGEFFSADPLSKIGKVAGLASVLIAKMPQGKIDNIVDAFTRRASKFDPRFDDRVREQAKLQGMQTVYDTPAPAPDPVSIFDLEGQPFVTSMSDRLDASGNIVSIDDVDLNRPVPTFGGQGHMFMPENQGRQVWSSAEDPVKQIQEMASALKGETGKNPLLMPWRMSPSGGDFSTTTGETMLSYASSNMDKADKVDLDDAIRNYVTVGVRDKDTGKMKGAGKTIGEWKGIDDPSSVDQWRNAPDVLRKELKNMMDVNFRDRGGLGIGEARLAVADPTQLNAPDAGLQNVGMIFADEPMIQMSGHPAYPRGIAGEGIGTLEEDIIATELLPELVKERGIMNPRSPSAEDKRAMMMKPYGGIITDAILRGLE